VKHLFLAVITCAALVFLPHTASPQETTPALHLPVPHADGNASVNLAADSIQRLDAPNLGTSPYASDVQLKGHVVIRMCCVQRSAPDKTPRTAKSEMIMHADEAEYHGATGEIEAHGTVRVSFQDLR
jgi:hypothetical protein